VYLLITSLKFLVVFDSLVFTFVLQFLQRQAATTLDTDSARLVSASMLEDDDRYSTSWRNNYF